MPLTVTTTRTTHTTSSAGVAVHTISFRGIAGAIFVLLAIATVLFVIAFATEGWAIRDTSFGKNHHYGLWRICSCGAAMNADWYKAVQAMMCIGLIGLLAAMITICLYMCVHTISKNQTILALTIICFLTVVFMVIGFIIFGAKMETASWSFALAVIASICCLVAGILSIVQMRNAGLA